MPVRRSLRLAVLVACALPAIRAEARLKESTGMRNGGSAIACAQANLRIAEEYAASGRFAGADDRETFIRAALARVSEPRIARLLREWWDRYGDSETWPETDRLEAEVYYYYGPALRKRYPSDGVIRGSGVGDPEACGEHLFDPRFAGFDRCCNRVLVSYFGEESAQPTRMAAAYSVLTRYQKNVLELHEAVYRLARELGAHPRPGDDVAALERATLFYAGFAATEVPATWVEGAVAALISSDGRAADAFLDRLWAWSRAIYRDGRARPTAPFAPEGLFR